MSNVSDPFAESLNTRSRLQIKTLGREEPFESNIVGQKLFYKNIISTKINTKTIFSKAFQSPTQMFFRSNFQTFPYQQHKSYALILSDETLELSAIGSQMLSFNSLGVNGSVMEPVLIGPNFCSALRIKKM